MPGFGLLKVFPQSVAERLLPVDRSPLLRRRGLHAVESIVRIEDVGLAQREVERQRLAARMDVHLVAARQRRGAALVVLQRALGVRLAVHGEHRHHERGPPVSAAIASMYSGVPRGPVAITKMPRLKHFSSPYQSASALRRAAIVDGIGRPPQPLWFGENDEAKPAAPPASPRALRLSFAPAARALGMLPVEASSPITAVRMVECCASTPTLA